MTLPSVKSKVPSGEPALGDSAPTVLKALQDYSIKQAVLPLDAINAKGELVDRNDGTVVEIPSMLGVKAVCTAGNPEKQEPPMIDLVFSSLWSESVWVFLGRHAGAYVEIQINDRQLGLKLPVPVESGTS